MKIPVSLKRNIFISMVLALLFVPSGTAMPRLSRELTGMVCEISEKPANLSILPSNSQKIRKFKLKDTAHFVKNHSFTSSSAFKNGDFVKVRYRAPLFSDAYVTMLTWMSQEKDDPQLEKMKCHRLP